ncbi:MULTISPECIES: serine hydrolase [unclassified Streptomyces]|uniref:serine hydrolase domain-containing protein n=1 Tax=unclassified Streptomyces TaxID=2593676 RepID=UPI001F03B6EF|nr:MULTISPECIES: serine hydrolase domain-containing protein [unclassified Streptomyces]MCH0564625.1 beta-lactamase family protein [Streptomyces sp. MUM 2J]MCH0573316.1 beta-lactamase family protein [Streptomyces sp. MUM 136J]
MTTRKRFEAGMVGLAAATVLAATAFTAPAQASQEAAAPATGHRATQRALDAAVAAGVPGVTAQARDAHGVWSSASGVGNLSTGAPRRTNERFRVGSITNTFVATVLLQMEAEKRLSLDDSVERHLPGLVRGNGNDGREITVRQLLNHTSGLFDYLADEQYVATYMVGEGYLRHRYDTLTPGQRVQVALSHRPLFKPGARHWFSHTNDILAALIVEEIGGRSYEDEIRDRILRPLRLKATSNPGDSVRLPRPSGRGYAKLFPSAPDRIDDVTELNASQSWGDGDIISSTRDLNRFYRALMRGKLLPPRQLKAMKTTVDNPDFPGSSYGLGIERFTTSCGTPFWYHDGGMVGWLTLAATTEDGSHQITLNYNSSWGAETVLPILNAEYCEAPSPSR